MDSAAEEYRFRVGRITIPAAWRSYLVYAAWAQALAATAGSLYFSEVRDFVPCMLCWYQRILMYPLVVIIAVGIVRRDSGLYWTVLPLSLAGACVAIYHNLVQQGVISEAIISCQFGVSCQLKWIEWLGFITIPMMSLTAFAVITILMTIYAASWAVKYTGRGDEK
ncbi:MAG: disulfide oxidoreductase [Armatimonadota bacterium]